MKFQPVKLRFHEIPPLWWRVPDDDRDKEPAKPGDASDAGGRYAADPRGNLAATLTDRRPSAFFKTILDNIKIYSDSRHVTLYMLRTSGMGVRFIVQIQN